MNINVDLEGAASCVIDFGQSDIKLIWKYEFI